MCTCNFHNKICTFIYQFIKGKTQPELFFFFSVALELSFHCGQFFHICEMTNVNAAFPRDVMD